MRRQRLRAGRRRGRGLPPFAAAAVLVSFSAAAAAERVSIHRRHFLELIAEASDVAGEPIGDDGFRCRRVVIAVTRVR